MTSFTTLYYCFLKYTFFVERQNIFTDKKTKVKRRGASRGASMRPELLALTSLMELDDTLHPKEEQEVLQEGFGMIDPDEYFNSGGLTKNMTTLQEEEEEEEGKYSSEGERASQ